MAAPNFANRTLYHGDNLAFLRGMNSESIHLIATDPPFNKGKDFHATPDSLAAGARFSPASAKSIIDEIDRVLANHYGFTDEELDFIINYDIKYPHGAGGVEMRNRIVPPHVPDRLKSEVKRSVNPVKTEERGKGVCLYVTGENGAALREPRGQRMPRHSRI